MNTASSSTVTTNSSINAGDVERPLVSVIMPAYNASGTIRASIESVLGQTHAPLELIVINDGSSDETEAVVRGYGDRVTYRAQSNQGVSAARNHGLRLAAGPYIAFLDSDDVWLPHKTERMLAALDAHPDIGFLTCRYDVVDEANRVIGESTLGGGFTGSTAPGAVLKLTDLYPMLFLNHVGPPCGWLLRRACYDEVGGFDETLLNAAEDWELGLRIAKRFEIGQLNEKLYLYREAEVSTSSAHHAARLLRAELMMLDKIFADPGFDFGWLAQRRAYSRRYERAAFAYGEIDRRGDVLRALLKSIAHYPPSMLSKEPLHHALRATLGRERLERFKRNVRGRPD